MSKLADNLHNQAPPGSLEEKDLLHLLHPTTNLKQHLKTGPVIHARAKGVYVWDSHGKQYLEGMAGLWCTALGYGEEELVRVTEEQMRSLCYSPLFASRSNEPSILLAEKLKAMVPFDAGKVFFGLSGSDANDSQMKFIWYYNNAIGRPEKKKFIARQRGYHGVTVASGSLTGLPAFHARFDLPIAGVLHTDAPHYYRAAYTGESEVAFVDRIVQNLEQLINSEGAETIAAFIAEPVMGAGGVIVPPETYYEKVQAVLRKHDILFVDDEVICGFGRTGNAFGAETFGITPDTMSLAKALSSAYLPLSAVLIPDSMFEPLVEMSAAVGTFGHGFTYTGHPVCTAVALKTLEIMQQRRLFHHAETVGKDFQARIRSFEGHPLVGEARGVGLIAAIELVADKNNRTVFEPSLGVGAYCAARCEEHGLIVRNLGDSIAFCPPLIITSDQIGELFDKFALALDETLDKFGSDS